MILEASKFLNSLIFFQNLRFLNLSYSNFGGNIPPQLGNLSELHVLSLGSFHGPFYDTTSMANMKWLSTLGMLHHLDMSGMDLSKATDWLQVINTLPSLFQLHLSGCELSNLHMYVLSVNLTSLSVLDLSCNDFNTPVSHFFECKSPALESLSLPDNYITGIIHRSIGNLSFLITLDLGFNQVSGPIPYSIGRLSSLERLYVGYNQINGSFPNSVGQLSSLEMLDAMFNKLDGNLLDSMGQLSSLEKLSISYNRLDGSLPDSLGQLSKLISLDFSYNLLTGVVTEDHLIKLVGLKDLKGSANKLILRLQVASWIPPFQLGTLSLRNWVLGPQFPLWLQSQKDLEELDISNTCISSPMPESFVRSFSKLWYLNMSNKNIRGPLLFSGIPATLEYIDISSNGFRRSLHPLLCSSGVTSTIVLNLENNNLSGDIPECWEKWPWLVVLNLENNSLFDWKQTYFLRILHLGSNRFDGNIPHELCHIRHIQILDLAQNNLSGNIPRCLNNFSVLSGIESNSGDDFAYVSIDGPERPIAGDSLVTNGREDTYSSILPLVMLIDISSNNLIGYIPSELMSLLELKSLNLSRNQLSGSISEKIGNMKELISLDLSVIRLSGNFP
ncbi:putative leucine-rich repeat domain superfamily [Helianthus anomalus]